MKPDHITLEKQWSQRGRAHLWHYEPPRKRRYRGWHIALDTEAALSIGDLLRRMRDAGVHKKRTVTMLPPTEGLLKEVRNKREKALVTTGLRLIYEPQGDPEQWRLELNANTLELEVGRATLGRLIDALDAVLSGEGDFQLGEPTLRFWWYRP